MSIPAWRGVEQGTPSKPIRLPVDFEQPILRIRAAGVAADDFKRELERIAEKYEQAYQKASGAL